MADHDDTRPEAQHPEANEPTQVLPQAGSDSPWARSADTNQNWAQPNPASRYQNPAAFTSGYYPSAPAGQPSAGQVPHQPGGATQPGYQQGPAQTAYGQQQPGQPYPGQQAGYPQQGYYAQQYYAGQYGGQHYQGQQYPGHYPNPGQYPNQGPYGYYAQPTATKKNRWPVAVAALVAAFLLVATGSALAFRQLDDASPSITTTEPQTQPSSAPSWPSGQDDPSSQQDERQGRGGTTTSNQVSAAQSQGVVLIEAETSSGTAAGTGMVLTADGKVLTNYHVVAGSTKLSVTEADSGNTYSAQVVGFDQTQDVALLQLSDASGLATVDIDDDQVSVGDDIAAVGNANGGGELVKAAGQVTATDQDLTVSSDSPWGNTEDLSGLIQTDAGAVPGDSGGPMYDAENEVLGMTTAGSTDEGTSYAVPIATALAVVQQIETGHDAGTVRVGPAGFLGIKVAESTTGGSGKTITEVVEDSPAAAAGVTAGSRLTKVGDTTITSKTNLATVIRALEPGQQVKITWVTSSGNQKQATVTLGSSPVN